MTKVLIQYEDIECVNDFDDDAEAVHYAEFWANKLETDWDRDCDGDIVITG